LHVAHILVFIYKIYAPYHKRSLVARAFLFFAVQVQSLDAHTHVGSSPIVGPFLSELLAFFNFIFSVSGYTDSFFFALRNLSRLDIAPPKNSHLLNTTTWFERKLDLFFGAYLKAL
jgi:hypothetical protein